MILYAVLVLIPTCYYRNKGEVENNMKGLEQSGLTDKHCKAFLSKVPPVLWDSRRYVCNYVTRYVTEYSMGMFLPDICG